MIPAKKLRLKVTPQPVTEPSAVGVRVVMSARLGPAPLTTWVKLGERVLLVQDQQVGWRVLADVTTRPRMHAHIYGLSLMVQPHFLTNRHLTVIYGPDQAQEPARTLFGTGSSVVKMLHNKYGGGVAGRHMVLYLVGGLSQGEKLTGAKIGRKETPEGWQFKDFAYIDYDVWRGDTVITQNSVVAHELTHVASHTMLRGAPHSLIEGVAMYEENRFLHHLDFGFTLSTIRPYYAAGTFPASEVWGVQSADWGLKNGTAIEACYEDGEAMSAVIIERHGGVPALARLAKAFRSFHSDHYSHGTGRRGLPAGARRVVRHGRERGSRHRPGGLAERATRSYAARVSNRCVREPAAGVFRASVASRSRSASVASSTSAPNPVAAVMGRA